MEYTKRDIRTFSMLGQQGSVGLALSNLKKDDDNLLVMSADLCGTSGLSRFQHAHPDSFINVGIAEQNMVGMASGLAACGYKVFASSFSNFIAMRAVEFARSDVAYMNLDVKLIGIGAGFAMGQFGNTHYGLEDVAMMSAIPGMTVIEPADGLEAAKAVGALIDFSGPAYLRLTGGTNLPSIYTEDYEFRIGKSYTLRDGTEAAIVGAGSIIGEALAAAEQLESEGISVSVVNMPTLRPIDTDILDSLLDRFDKIYVVEEHGFRGLYAEIAVYAASVSRCCRIVPIGSMDCFTPAGTREYMLADRKLNAASIAEKISAETRSIS